MKANLESRKSVRLNWFKQKKVPFILKRSMEWEYYPSTVVTNELTHEVLMQYSFSGLKEPIPGTSIIIFADQLPHAYMETPGSVGDKFSTEKTPDSNLTTIDRIVKVDLGEEKVSKKPVPPHEAHMYKEIQIHERRDKIIRKITVKNETNKPIDNLELTFIENKEIRFLKSKPEPHKTDAPEYKWEMEIPAEGTTVIELTVESYTKATYRIEKEKTGRPELQK